MEIEVKDPDVGSGGSAEEDLGGLVSCSRASRPGRDALQKGTGSHGPPVLGNFVTGLL
jgi:hypothetical protein